MPIGGGSITVTNIVQPASVDFPDFPEYPDEIMASLVGVYGKWKDALIDQSEDDDLSEEVDLGAPFQQMQIEIPTMDGTDIELMVARATDGTYYRLGDGTAVIHGGEGAFTTTVMLGGYRFVKVHTTNPQTADRTIRVRGSNV